MHDQIVLKHGDTKGPENLTRGFPWGGASQETLFPSRSKEQFTLVSYLTTVRSTSFIFL